MAGRDIDQPILVVCEGPSDCGLINHLIKEHSILGIQSACPKQGDAGDGFAAIPKLLKLLSDAGQLARLRGLVLVVDANGNPANRYSAAAAMLASVNVTVTHPFTAVYLFPRPNQTGCLEDLLLEVIESVDRNLIGSVGSFATAVGKPLSWPPNKQAKMRVHSLIAACCEEDPASSLSWVWSKRGNPIPLNSPKFADLVRFLRDLEMVAASCSVADALGALWSA